MDGERALVQRLGLGVAAGDPVEPAQDVEGDGEVGMVGAEGFLADGERAPAERLGFGVAAGEQVEPA